MKKKEIAVLRYSDDWLIERLKNDPKEFEIYIEHIAQEYEKDKDLDMLLDCLKIAIMAKRGAATKIAKTSKMDRSAIYKALSNHSKPRIDTFQNILNGIGWDFKLSKVS
jgi:DNA-binding phage protein